MFALATVVCGAFITLLDNIEKRVYLVHNNMNNDLQSRSFVCHHFPLMARSVA
jgi:hypothetical protein